MEPMVDCHITVDADGRIVLPEALRRRQQMAPGAPLRLIETAAGIFLTALPEDVEDDDPALELAGWQQLGAEAVAHLAEPTQA